MKESNVAVTIFWRIILGSLAILFVAAGVSSFSIFQFGGFSRDASAVLNKDNRMLLDEDKLTEVFLSEVRYTGKFIITQASAHYDQARQFRNDFRRYLAEIKTLATLPDIKARLRRIEEFHDRYGDLYDQEVRYLKNRQPYAETRYKQEKEKVLDLTLKELEQLKGGLQQNLHAKLERMEKAGRRARAIAVVTTLILLVLGLALSFMISKSITTPLLQLTQRIVQNTDEDEGAAFQYSRIPELDKLAEALKKAKAKLCQVAEKNVRFVESITEEIETPLISFQKRLGYLRRELSRVVTAEHETALEVLADETEYLIQRCAQLRQPTELQAEAANHQLPGTGDETAASSVKLFPLRTRSKYLHRVKLSIASLAMRGARLAAGPWHSIYQSLRTIKYGKARKS
jgi:CHASE3 domain sensor protein